MLIKKIKTFLKDFFFQEVIRMKEKKSFMSNLLLQQKEDVKFEN